MDPSRAAHSSSSHHSIEEKLAKLMIKDEHPMDLAVSQDEDKKSSGSHHEQPEKKLTESPTISRQRIFPCYPDCGLTFEGVGGFLEHLVEFHSVKVIRAPYSYWLQWNLDILEGNQEDDDEKSGKRWSTIVICPGAEAFLFKVEQDTNDETGVLGDYHIQIWNLNTVGTFLAIVRFSEGGYQGQWVWHVMPGHTTTQAVLPKVATDNLPINRDSRRILTLMVCLQAM